MKDLKILGTVDELSNWLNKGFEENRRLGARYRISFDQPRNGKAMMHVIDDTTEETIIVVNCFTWDQLRYTRIAMSYGDNHRSSPKDWRRMQRILSYAVFDVKHFSVEQQ